MISRITHSLPTRCSRQLRCYLDSRLMFSTECGQIKYPGCKHAEQPLVLCLRISTLSNVAQRMALFLADCKQPPAARCFYAEMAHLHRPSSKRLSGNPPHQRSQVHRSSQCRRQPLAEDSINLSRPPVFGQHDEPYNSMNNRVWPNTQPA